MVARLRFSDGLNMARFHIVVASFHTMVARQFIMVAKLYLKHMDMVYKLRFSSVDLDNKRYRSSMDMVD